MKHFYHKTLEFKIKSDDNENYVEFENEGVRFALTTSAVMYNATGNPEYTKKASGHRFELAFPCDSPEKVDTQFKKIIEHGATAIKEPAQMPWGQYTAFFADPDGNIHELFAD